MFLLSCENDPQQAKALANTDNAQVDIAKDVRLMYKESGKLTALITAPLMHRYFRNENKIEFPEGVVVELYNNGNLTCTINAGYGMRDETTKRMDASKGVKVQNYKKEQMESEEMVWSEVAKEIRVDGKVKVTTPNDVLYGVGLVADDQFNNYTMSKITGRLSVEDNNIPGR